MTSIPPDLDSVLDVFGIRKRETILRGPSALIVHREPGKPVIIEVNATDPEPAKRFAVAYELMRWIVGREKLQAQSTGRRSGGVMKPVRHDTPLPHERGETDSSTGVPIARLMLLATDTLMPRESLRALLTENGGDTRAAAAAFGVNEEVVRLRAKTMRLP